MINDAITVLATLDGQPCNKNVRRLPDGSLHKAMAVNRGQFSAWTVPCPDLAAFAEVLREVGNHPDRMISLSTYRAAPTEPFQVVPMDKLAELIGCSPSDRERLKGWHDIDGTPTCARMKENVDPSSILLFDRDYADGMPPELADLSPDEWRAALDLLFPGLAAAGRIELPSTSTRVLVDGEPVAAKSGHTYVQITDPADIAPRWDQAALRACITTFSPAPWLEDVLLAFGKPIYRGGEVSHKVWWPIFDKSVSGPGRLVFVGQPIVDGAGLTVAPPDVRVHDGPRLDLRQIKDLTQRDLKDITAAISAIRGTRTSFTVERCRVGADGKTRISSIEEVVHDLTLDLKVETPSGWTTIGALVNGREEHVRLQSPYRDSASWAAFYSMLGGSPFVFDMGDMTKHVLNIETLQPARMIILDWMQNFYEPTCRTRDGAIFSEAAGVKIPLVRVMPTFEVMDSLKLSYEVPRDDAGRIKGGEVPKVFTLWKTVAYGELLKMLPVEGDDGAASIAMAAEFAVQIENLLAAMVTINPGSGEQRHAIGAWARMYANLQPGHWCQVKTYPLWGRVSHPGGPLELALKPSLASVLKICPEIQPMTDTRFTRLCKSYGFSPEDNRIRLAENVRIRATILVPEFVKRIHVSHVSDDEFAHALSGVLGGNEETEENQDVKSKSGLNYH